MSLRCMCDLLEPVQPNQVFQEVHDLFHFVEESEDINADHGVYGRQWMIKNANQPRSSTHQYEDKSDQNKLE